jgi:hypothetical protein
LLKSVEGRKVGRVTPCATAREHGGRSDAPYLGLLLNQDFHFRFASLVKSRAGHPASPRVSQSNFQVA